MAEHFGIRKIYYDKELIIFADVRYQVVYYRIYKNKRFLCIVANSLTNNFWIVRTGTVLKLQTPESIAAMDFIKQLRGVAIKEETKKMKGEFKSTDNFILSLSVKELLNIDTDELSRRQMRIRVLLLIYAKLHLNCEDFGEATLSELLFDTLTETLGDQAYLKWMNEYKARNDV